MRASSQLVIQVCSPVFAHEMRAVLAMPTEAYRAFHVTFHRDENAVGAEAALRQFLHGKAHHHFGAADHRYAVVRIKRRPRNQRGDDTNVAAPIAAITAGCCVERNFNFKIKLPTPLLQFARKQQITRRSCAK